MDKAQTGCRSTPLHGHLSSHARTFLHSPSLWCHFRPPTDPTCMATVPVPTHQQGLSPARKSQAPHEPMVELAHASTCLHTETHNRPISLACCAPSHVRCCQVTSIKPSTSLLPEITHPITSSPATANLLPSMKDHACSLPTRTSFMPSRTAVVKSRVNRSTATAHLLATTNSSPCPANADNQLNMVRLCPTPLHCRTSNSSFPLINAHLHLPRAQFQHADGRASKR